MQDVIPPEKRKSVRDIPIPSNRKNSVHKKVKQEQVRPTRVQQEEFVDEEPPVRMRQQERGRGGKKWIGLVVVAIIIVLIVFGLSLRNIEVKIYQKELTSTINAEVQASENSNDRSTTLQFKTVEISTQSSQKVPATGEEYVSEKASGNIMVFNTYSEEMQRLVKNTRFESAEGLIYRIPESIIVPGFTEDIDGSVVPGSIEVEVFADEVGEEYNIQETEFTIPGFEGLPQFDGFYAETKKKISGGMDGVRKIISDDDRNSAETTLQEALEAALAKEVSEKTEPGLLIFSDPSMQIFEVIAEEASEEDVIITMKGSAELVLLDTTALSNTVAAATINPFDPARENVLIENINTLDISVSPGTNEDSEERVMTITVSGQADFVWQTDTKALAKAIAGNPISILKERLDVFPSITKVGVSKKVFWKNHFPDNAEKIDIIIAH